MSIVAMTYPAAGPRLRSAAPSMLLGAGYSARRQAMWRHVEPTVTNGQGADAQANPVFTTVVAAKQGGPPRGVSR